MEREKKIVLALLAFGFLLRLYSSVYGTITEKDAIASYDEIFVSIISIGTFSSPLHRLSTLNHGPVYMYLADMAYGIFGANYAGSRFFPVIFSSVSIILTYLVARELYNNRIALYASAIFALSSAQILYGSLGLYESVYTALTMASLLFFLKWLKSDSRSHLLLSAARNHLLISTAFFAAAVNTKIVVLYMLPVYGAAFLLAKKDSLRASIGSLHAPDNLLASIGSPRPAIGSLLASIRSLHPAIGSLRASASSIKSLALPLLLFLFLMLPIPAYNYLLYNQNGLTDFNTARLFKVQSSLAYYHDLNIVGIDNPWLQPDISASESAFISYILNSLSLPFILLALAGILAAAKLRKRVEDALLLLWLGVPVVLYVLYIYHAYYVLFILPPLSILAAIGAINISERFGEKKQMALKAMLALAILWELGMLALSSGYKPAPYQLMDYAASIPAGSTVITDPLISWNNVPWIFNSVPALPASIFRRLTLQLHDQGLGDDASVNLYYIMCSLKNCGWDEENAMKYAEESAAFRTDVQANLKKVADISAGSGQTYSVYVGQGRFPSPVLEYMRVKKFFGYVVGHPELSIDAYETKDAISSALNAIAHFSLYINILLAFAGLALGPYVLLKEKEES